MRRNGAQLPVTAFGVPVLCRSVESGRKQMGHVGPYLAAEVGAMPQSILR